MSEVRVSRVFSHNDEEHGNGALVSLAGAAWLRQTLALSQGVGQIEIDVWLWEVSGKLELLAAHMESEIRPENTLDRLYLGPIMEILDRNKASSQERTWTGLYASDPTKTVSIAIDVVSWPEMTWLSAEKNKASEMWEHLVDAFEPFRQKGYLTTFDPSTREWSSGPLRVIGTGDTPLECVQSMSPRSIFLDAKLHDLVPPPGYTPETPLSIDASVAPMASGYFLPRWVESLRNSNREDALKEMRAQTAAARAMGIESRWWGAPRDADIREHIWRIQLDADVDWLSGDDLAGMTAFWWKFMHSRG